MKNSNGRKTARIQYHEQANRDDNGDKLKISENIQVVHIGSGKTTAGDQNLPLGFDKLQTINLYERIENIQKNVTGNNINDDGVLGKEVLVWMMLKLKVIQMNQKVRGACWQVEQDKEVDVQEEVDIDVQEEVDIDVQEEVDVEMQEEVDVEVQEEVDVEVQEEVDAEDVK